VRPYSKQQAFDHTKNYLFMKLPLHAFLVGAWLLISSFSAQALHPSLSASLYDHMVEVNREWLHQVDASGDLILPTNFEHDTERIQTHLIHVEAILRQRTASMPLTEAQQAKRLAMLDALTTYAESGKYPVNTGHSYRIPYFIDDWGTPCAVGHLLIESGFEAVAQRSKCEINNAYVREIPYKELPAWAKEHGFLVEELAWIQPGYPPSYRWGDIGGSGANAPANLMLKDTLKGGVLIFGAFTELGGVACHGAARVNGNIITPLDSFPLAGAETATFFEGKLWVGGQFQLPQGEVANLATWNDTAWTFSHVGFGPVHCLHVHDGAMYAGGEFPSAIFDNLARYENGGWYPMGYLGPIYSMITYQGNLVVGGDFDKRWGAGISYIGMWDGMQWQALATTNDTLDAPVRALAVMDGELFAGGEIMNKASERHFGLARFDEITGSWFNLLPNSHWYFHYNGLDSIPNYIDRMYVESSRLFFSGSFMTLAGLTQGTSLGAFSYFTGGYVEPLGNFSTPLSDLLVVNDTVYAVGAFDRPAKHAAVTELVFSSIPQDPRFEDLVVYPNPAQDMVMLKWNVSTPGIQISIDLYDLTGKRMEARFQADSQAVRLFRDNLPAGAYAFVLREGEQVLHRGRVIFR